jgi:hypothetical protein
MTPRIIGAVSCPGPARDNAVKGVERIASYSRRKEEVDSRKEPAADVVT